MRKIATLIITALLFIGLAGCAATSPTDANMKVKCPACGHEFGTAGAKALGP